MTRSTQKQKFFGFRALVLGRYSLLVAVSCALLAGTTLLLAQNTSSKSTDPLQSAPPVEKGLPIKVTATTDKKSYAVGAPIKMTLTVKNVTQEPVPLRFSSGQRFDFVLREGTKPTGKIIWQWARGHMFTMMVASEKLEPGKTLTFTAIYPTAEAAGKPNTPLATGTYTLTATLTTMGAAPRPVGTTMFTVTEP